MASSDRLGPSRPWSSSPTLARLQRLTRDPARMLVPTPKRLPWLPLAVANRRGHRPPFVAPSCPSATTTSSSWSSTTGSSSGPLPRRIILVSPLCPAGHRRRSVAIATSSPSSSAPRASIP
ncbi:hypothetical protein VPH35_066122 [Triticum aestivum]